MYLVSNNKIFVLYIFYFIIRKAIKFLTLLDCFVPRSISTVKLIDLIYVRCKIV